MATQPSTVETLEAHNRDVLILTAKEKLSAGKKLTKQEIAAVEAAEKEKQRGHDLPYMRRMPKGEYIERFGGNNQSYINWRQRYGFPWPDRSDTVDAIACLCWYRDYFAESAGKALAPADNGAPVGAEARYRDAKAAMAEVQLKALLGEYLHADDVKADEATLLATVRGFVEGLPRQYQEEWTDLISEVAAKWQVAIDAGIAVNGRGPANAEAPLPRKSAPAKDAHPPRVRGAVRKARNRAGKG